MQSNADYRRRNSMIFVPQVIIKDISSILPSLEVMLGGDVQDVAEVFMKKVETPCSPSDK